MGKARLPWLGLGLLAFSSARVSGQFMADAAAKGDF